MTRSNPPALSLAREVLAATVEPISIQQIQEWTTRHVAMEPAPVRFDRYVDAEERHYRRARRELHRLVSSLLMDARGAPLSDEHREDYAAALAAIVADLEASAGAS